MFETEYPVSERINSFMYGVYGWMSAGLVVTASTAYYVALVPVIFRFIYSHSIVLITLFIFQIGLVLGLSYFLSRLTLFSMTVMFLLYSFSLGITLSFIFYLYTAASIISTFFTTAGMFGIMALYGYTTRTDLTTMGNISIMMVIGLILGSVINLFLQNSMMDFILSGVGVLVFTLLTAYDTQKIKQLGQYMLADQETMGKVMLLGALTLYLDFINLFLYLLRFMGKRREN